MPKHRWCACAASPDRGCPGDDLLNQFLGAADAGLYSDVHNPLAVELGGVHVLVRGDDDTVGCRDFRGAEGVFDTDLPVRFDPYRYAELFCGLFQWLPGHERVRDAGGAAGRGDYFVGAMVFP